MAYPKQKKSFGQPPRLADRFLTWFCKDEWLEPLRGDLEELYQINRKQYGTFRADLLYWRNVINLLRPFALKKDRFTSNYTAMLQNVFKTFFRQMRRNPSQNLIHITGLCVGFCVVFLTVSWVNYHTSFDRFHSGIDNIYEIKTNSLGSDGVTQTYGGVVFEVSEEAKNQLPEVKEVTRIMASSSWPSKQCFKIDEDKPCLYACGIFADSSFFNVFDFQIIAGAKNPLTKPKSIALSASVAQKVYGDENPVGKTYLLGNHREVHIAAVYQDPPVNSSLQFEFIAPFDVLYTLRGADMNRIWENSFITYAKLDNADPYLVGKKIKDLEITEKYENYSYLLHPLEDKHLYTKFEDGKVKGGLVDYIKIIGLFSLFILVMSIVNFINLTTAQASIRGKEIGVRKVNGASKWVLHIQFLFETFLKVCLAGILALAIAFLTVPILGKVIEEPIQFTVSLQLVFQILSVIFTTTLLAGFYPALVMSRFNPIQILKNGPFQFNGRGSARKWLTVIQISISGIIVILTSVFYLQLEFLQTESLGYDRKGIIQMEPSWQHIKGFDSFKAGLTLHHQIKALGITNANMINANNSTTSVDWEGKNKNDEPIFQMIAADNGLIDVFGLELIEGRGFTPSDTIKQVVLTASAAKRMNLENPIGQTVNIWQWKAKISGVIEDFKSSSLHSEMLPTILFEIPPQYSSVFYIKYDNSQPIKAIEIIEEEYAKLEPFFDIKYKILDEEYQKAYNDEKVVSTLSSFVMIIALVIALIGILGLSTFNIIRRYREIGLRKIFGASGVQIIRLLSMEFVIIVLIANVIAWGSSYWFMEEWLSGFAYRIDIPYMVMPINLIITLGVIFLLVGLQASKVSKQNPAEVVKIE